MCGNFGLLTLTDDTQTQEKGVDSVHNIHPSTDVMDRSMNESMHRVSKLDGLRIRDENDDTETDVIKSPLIILEAQAANTEIRGGQAGGFSSFQYSTQKVTNQINEKYPCKSQKVPSIARVRMVARKRYPLASDLKKLFIKKKGKNGLKKNSTLTVIGHTRFATSSVNIESELHPHEWTPFRNEKVWTFNITTGKFENSIINFGIHISHNGDFDALEAYSQTVVVDEVGMWLERIHHVPNNCRGDSPKIAGMMDLLRVQGRWGPAARLSWVRTVNSSISDVCGGSQISKTAPNTFPDPDFWSMWGTLFEQIWNDHVQTVISLIEPQKFDINPKYRYKIDSVGMKTFVDVICEYIDSKILKTSRANDFRISKWSTTKLRSFVFFTVKGFLYADIYNSLTEFLSRAEGSFGIQVHTSLEPGVVAIASKGQPMSIAFDPVKPIVLFASEAEALAVPVYESGKWLPNRIDLDSHGEIFRLGIRRSLIEGTFSRDDSSDLREKHLARYLTLDCGIEIRSYSLVTASEATQLSLINRTVSITSAPVPYDPSVDLVAKDLSVTTAVLNAIDVAWSNKSSIESLTSAAFTKKLIDAMKRRLRENVDTIDLIVSGVEASLWVGEQFASDIRKFFPLLNVKTVSANKLIGLGEENASKVFFPSSEEIMLRKIDKYTTILLISQSGQTFGTLHATKKLARLIPSQIFILTGCFHSKMELAIVDGYNEKNLVYQKDRVFNNYSGHRPAEPTSVAIAATWHSLTKILVDLIQTTRDKCPAGRIVQPWVLEEKAYIIQHNYRLHRLKKAIKNNTSKEKLKQLTRIAYSRKPIFNSSKSKDFFKASRLLNLSDGCIENINSLLKENLLPNVAQITGYDHFANRIIDPNDPNYSTSTNASLIHQGRQWAKHINETWRIIVFSSIYIFFSVGFGIPIIGLIADAILAIIRAGHGDRDGFGYGYFSFAARSPHLIYHQSESYTVIGCILQFLDALLYIYIGFLLTKVLRWIEGRPINARLGRRTIVIVDTPCVHQLVEIFVSKLFSQSYGFLTVDVHGASGLDHFVHRFTHRVVRGLLIAVGRPDGRLSCLSKSEASILLAVKQAAFICNPAYSFPGNGPEIVTVGHNPFQPNLGLAHNIVLHAGSHNITSTETTLHGSKLIIPQNRRLFVDEYLYERLFLASKPYTITILRSLRKSYELGHQLVRTALKYGNNNLSLSYHSKYETREDLLPYGVHNINPNIINDVDQESTLFSDFVLLTKEILKNKGNVLGKDGCATEEIVKSDDPAVRLAFSSKLDSQTRLIQESQVGVQMFYESRIASLERYIAFCVMFHAMAKDCCKPWFRKGWDMARSQSNLRVATTASPIASGHDTEVVLSQETKKMANYLHFKLRKVKTNF